MTTPNSAAQTFFSASLGPPGRSFIMERANFYAAYQDYCLRRNIRLAATIQIENRLVDLWNLHRVVSQEVDYSQINQKAYWDIISGKLGFIAVPVELGRPCRSDTALQLGTFYKEYLQEFYKFYSTRLYDPMRADQQAGHPTTQVHLNSTQLAHAVAYSLQSIQNLRQMGVDERIIGLVHANRALLLQGQGRFNFRLAEGGAGNVTSNSEQTAPTSDSQGDPVERADSLMESSQPTEVLDDARMCQE